MDNKSRQTAIKILTEHLESNKLRKTPERFAVLDAVYSFSGHFRFDELNAHLEKENFRVSRATLYNTLKLFADLRLVIVHRLLGETFYEAGFAHDVHSYQVCTICGKVKAFQLPQLANVLKEAKLPRFHKDGMVTYFYGVCSTCRAKLSRQKRNSDNKTNK